MICAELEQGIGRQLDLSTTLDPDEAMALAAQQKEVSFSDMYLALIYAG